MPMKSNMHRQLVAVRAAEELAAARSCGRFTSPSRMPSPVRRPRKARSAAQVVVRVGELVLGRRRRPPVSSRNGTASTRKPETPSSSQKPITLAISSRTCGLADVEVGLVLVEAVQVVLARSSRRSSQTLVSWSGKTTSGACSLRRLVAPDVPVAVRRGLARPGRAEPRVLVGGVVDDEVDDHPHAAVAGGADQLDEVAVRAEPRVDAVEVGDVVAVVAVGRRVERHQPQAGDAELGEVVDALREARRGRRCRRRSSRGRSRRRGSRRRRSSTTGRWCR